MYLLAFIFFSAPSTSPSSTSLLRLSPDGKTKSKIKNEEEHEKGSVSDSGTIESVKEKGVFAMERESSRFKYRGFKKKEDEKDANKFALI